MQKIRIGERYIGDEEPVLIIAEAGVNHNGDVGLAKRLVTWQSRLTLSSPGPSKPSGS